MVGDTDGFAEVVGSNNTSTIWVAEVAAELVAEGLSVPLLVTEFFGDADNDSIPEELIDRDTEFVTELELELVVDGNSVVLADLIAYVDAEGVAVTLLVTEIFEETEDDFVPEELLDNTAEPVSVRD